MVSFATLRTVRPAEFEEAADGYHAVSNAAGDAKDRLTDEILARALPDPGSTTTDSEGLVGAAAAAARRRLERLAESCHYTQVECGLVRAALNGFATDLDAAKKKLDGALDDARVAGFTVESDGSVTYPAAGAKVDGDIPDGGTAVAYDDPTAGAVADQAARFDPNPHRAAAQDCANRIASAVKEATDADSRWAPRLKALRAQNDLTVSHADWADVHRDQRAVQKVAGEYLDKADIPQGRPPAEAARWWTTLTREQQADYATLYPASIGALDGLPADVRDEANRAVLAQTKGTYETELAALPTRPGRPGYNQPGLSGVDTWRDRQERDNEWEEEHGAEYERLNDALTGIRAIEKQLGSAGQDGLPESYLLGFSGKDDGRAVIAVGNPDHADHTAVYVPGTTASLGNIEGDIDRVNNLWRDSAPIVPDQQVSTVAWLGYDAPDSVVRDAPFSHYAHDGASAFASFVDGLKETNSADTGGHHTAVAHSYGTTLVGATARQHDLNVDDVILAGSPGVEVGSAGELDVPEGHVWNQEAEGDPTPDVGRWSHGGENWEVGGGVRLVPSDEVFGAQQMTTDTQGHSDYWKEGTQSLRNQSFVITGNYERVQHEAP
ncbi:MULTISPECIES: alpha/beta hydrolase [Streptomyces]|uniref:alpha/beta hydrolase n=1 Tax=Streptomyces TaxID=1883 RepID=UPI00224885FC|nr:alpha/beta hydrolase [Streptomyces sp. JHD 1]MCX2967457.1 alpha/beta hydrolase [Streptomyces sp. JHD 1]